MNAWCGWVMVMGALLMPLGAHAATCESKGTDADAVVMAQHRAYLAHDVEAFAACYADDVVITYLDQERKPLVGIAALRDLYGDLFKRMPPGFHSEYLGKLVNGPLVVISERSVGGKSGKTPSGIAMFEVRDGKITHVWFTPFH
jgi:hypothetical protein